LPARASITYKGRGRSVDRHNGSAGSAERLGVPIVLVAASIVFALLSVHFAFLCDDAYISFRYSRHLSEGLGLRFNAAESPPVEGYSSMLWVLWLALFEALDVEIGRAAHVSSVLCGVVVLLLVLRLARRRLGLGLWSFAATALVLATLPPFFVWATGGLGTMVFALALFLVFERLVLDPAHPRALSAGVAGMATVLLRIDGALWLCAALIAALSCAPRDGRGRLVRAALEAGALGAVAVVAQFLFRAGYHDEWIPNLARVKTGLSLMRLERGAKYVASLLLELPFLALIPLLALCRRPARSRLALQSTVLVLFACLYAVFVGGDFMTMGRFLVPAVPFVALIFASLARGLETSGRGRTLLAGWTVLTVTSSLLCAFDRAPVPAAWRQSVHFRWNEPLARSEAHQWLVMRSRAEEWARLGRALALHTRPGESMVLPNLGAVSYYTELHAYDPFGLVSRDVARLEQPERRTSPGHDKGVDPSFFYDRRPVYLGAWLIDAGAPLTAGLPPDYERSPLARVSRIERFPLPEVTGQRPGQELRVLRMIWPEQTDSAK
jgi:arabinofuranosyltransferase